MKVNISNCNNIKNVELAIPKNKKTLLVANNGTGKSTITQAIVKNIQGEPLDELVSYSKNIDGPPRVEIRNPVKSVMCFDEHYSSEFIFGEEHILEDERTYTLMQVNSRTKELMEEVETLIASFKKCVENATLPERKDLETAGSLINKRTKKIKYTSKFKGLEGNNPLLDERIVNDFEPIIDAVDSPIKWNKWRKTYMLVEDICPYCSQKIDDKLLEAIITLDEGLEGKAVSSREQLVKVKDELDKSLNLDLSLFNKLVNDEVKLNEENISEYKEISEKLEILQNTREKILKLASENLYLEPINLNEIDISHLDILKDFEKINQEYQLLMQKNNELRANLGKINSQLRKSLDGNVTILNSFCCDSGIPYIFKVDEHKIILCYQGSEHIVSNPKNRLSFGEKNALSALFFGLIANYQDTELVILDDPFSSFDEHKRYFIYHYFFKKDGLLTNKTVLYLTHDVDPVIDLIYLKKPTKFHHCNALRNSLGNVSSTEIDSESILVYQNHLIDSAKNSSIDIIQFTHLRKLLETKKRYKVFKDIDTGLIYNYISSYTKGNYPKIKINRDKYIKMTDEQIDEAICDLKKFSSFYGIDLIKPFSNKDNFVSCADRYESIDKIEDKLIYIRYLTNRAQDEGIISSTDEIALNKYFKNMVYHIERERLFMINPCCYSQIPEYIQEMLNIQFKHLKSQLDDEEVVH